MKRTLLTMIGLAALSATTIAVPTIAQQIPPVEISNAAAAPQIEIPEGAFEIAVPNIALATPELPAEAMNASAPGADDIQILTLSIPSRDTRTTTSVIELGNRLRGVRDRLRARRIVVQTPLDAHRFEEVTDGEMNARVIIIRDDSTLVRQIPPTLEHFRPGRDGSLSVGPNTQGQRDRIRYRRIEANVVVVGDGASTTVTVDDDSISAGLRSVIVITRHAAGADAINEPAQQEQQVDVAGPQQPDISAVEAMEAARAGYSLSNATPNPVSANASISFTLPRGGQTKLAVFDNSGRVVATLADENLDAGTHTRTFDATSLPAGLYLYRLSSGSYAETKTMTVVR